MKVLKFGGSSVGSPESIQKVRNIALSQSEPSIIVVSALGGVTDMLLQISEMAREGDDSYKELLEGLRERHYQMCQIVIENPSDREKLIYELDSLLERLGRICEGVALLRVLPKKTSDEIVSFGERLSSRIVSALIPGSSLYDSLDFIRTTPKYGKDVVDAALTGELIRKTFAGFGAGSGVAVVPGFISRDSRNGEITNLGRGGSDYTASLLAAELNADVLEIWTDVDGFMTADPKIIKTSYVIEEMDYEEAMELCNFGAKVIYPPTLYPVCAKEIPIRVKNTFNPSAPGTIIKHNCESSDRSSIKGISSIDDISLLTLSGTSMVGIVGVDGRIFSALAETGISVFLISQSASETGISIGVGRKDADRAREALSEAFKHEISTGEIYPIQQQDGLAAVAVVGTNMKHHAGIMGKLFTTLGRNGISIIVCAQGASESNISFIIERNHLRKSLNVIHDSFFLSEYQELNLFICGIGTVGGQLIEQIAHQQEKLKATRNLKINVVGICRSTRGIFDRSGIELGSYRELLEDGEPLTPAKMRDEIIAMNIFNSVFVDCTASKDVADLYEDFFNHGISVVAANKIAASQDYEMYRKLKDTALRRGVKFLFETNVGAGLPIINTINDLCNSGDRIIKMEAVLSGTLNFIFNTISEDIPFSKTVRMAMEEGFSEPDPRIDLSGKAVIRKLVILSREAGYKVNQEDVEAKLFIPDEFFTCSMEEFWEKLPSLDADFERRRKELEASNMRWRFVACNDEGKLSVELRAVDSLHSFYVLDGSNNIVLLTTERYNKHPMLIQGYGAGAGVTAAGVFADIMSIANI